VKARIATAIAGVSIVALLSVAAASAKPQGLHIDVQCSQQSLVDAINAANGAGGGTLDLARGCDYQLTTSPDDSENGLPPITTPITVHGHHDTIDGTNSFRVFEVDSPGNLSANDLTITGGSAQDFGGGIANQGGTVTLDHTQVTGNSAVAAGGGIASATFDPSSVAKVTLNDSSVSGNQQTLDGPDGGLGGGGIISIVGTVTIHHSQVNGNDAEGFVGGGIASGDYFNFSDSGSVLTLDHSQVNGNTAPGAGAGGVQNLLGSVTIKSSQVNGNTSLNGGGISSGNANGGSAGPAELKLSHSQVSGNAATGGPGGEGPPVAAGGIANGSIAVLDHSRVDNNTAPNGLGAGILNHGTMTVNHSEVNGNTAAASGFPGSGGGILNVQTGPGTGLLTLDHSKVSHNTAGGNGGGIANGAGGPLSGGDVTLKHSEVTHNNAAHGGGIFNAGGTVTLLHSKVADNNPDNCYPPGTIAGCTG
jgi:hypothetical protein